MWIPLFAWGQFFSLAIKSYLVFILFLYIIFSTETYWFSCRFVCTKIKLLFAVSQNSQKYTNVFLSLFVMVKLTKFAFAQGYFCLFFRYFIYLCVKFFVTKLFKPSSFNLIFIMICTNLCNTVTNFQIERFTFWKYGQTYNCIPTIWTTYSCKWVKWLSVNFSTFHWIDIHFFGIYHPRCTNLVLNWYWELLLTSNYF